MGLCWVVCSQWDVFPARRSKRHWRDACAESEHERGAHADVKLPTWLGRTHNRETIPYESETAESQHDRKDNVKPYHRWISLFSISFSLTSQPTTLLAKRSSFDFHFTSQDDVKPFHCWFGFYFIPFQFSFSHLAVLVTRIESTFLIERPDDVKRWLPMHYSVKGNAISQSSRQTLWTPELWWTSSQMWPHINL